MKIEVNNVTIFDNVGRYFDGMIEVVAEISIEEYRRLMEEYKKENKDVYYNRGQNIYLE